MSLSKEEYLIKVSTKKSGKSKSYIITIPKEIAETLGLANSYVVIRYDPQADILIIKKAKVIA